MSYYAGKRVDTGNKYPQTPELVLDFHGYTKYDAIEALDELLAMRAYTCVRIIVGKGRNSPNGAVLPDVVRTYLTTHNIRFSQSKIQNGGEGALEVFLK